jgi:hypothetical protein
MKNPYPAQSKKVSIFKTKDGIWIQAKEEVIKWPLYYQSACEIHLLIAVYIKVVKELGISIKSSYIFHNQGKP